MIHVTLDEIVDAIDSIEDEETAYLDPQTGKIQYTGSDDENMDERSDDWIALPDKYERGDYHNMELFIEQVEDGEAGDWLENAIRGKGAFRRFRAAADKFHLLQDWYDFEALQHKKLAIAWCEENGIIYDSTASGEQDEDEEDSYDDDFDEETSREERKMRVCIMTLGSRGDVQPYVALGKELIKQGHAAVICTGGSFQKLIEENGVEFKETASDLMAIAQTPEGKAILEHPIRNMRLALRYSKEVINPAYRKTLDDFYNAAKGADMIVYHPKALGAVDIALSLRIPCVSMPPVPITFPASEFANLALTHKNLGPVLNKLSYIINDVKAGFNLTHLAG